MKIGDVEYQGDGNKAIFYYIADDRVDFRQLIKVLAETFKVRIEMKQIGARQEAGRIGGVGPCGRELCCSSWMTSFVSVSTSAARYQDLSLNPQKLAGQCAKLKCCLNYETDMYAEAQRDIPAKDIILDTKDSSYYLFKADVFKRTILYSTSKDFLANAVTIPVERAKQIIALNKKGIRVDSLAEEVEKEPVKQEFGDILGQDSLNRFDKSKKPNKNKIQNRGPRPEGQHGNASLPMEIQNDQFGQTVTNPEMENVAQNAQGTTISHARIGTLKAAPTSPIRTVIPIPIKIGIEEAIHPPVPDLKSPRNPGRPIQATPKTTPDDSLFFSHTLSDMHCFPVLSGEQLLQPFGKHSLKGLGFERNALFSRQFA